MNPNEEQGEFYRELVPRHFNQTLATQRAAAVSGADDARVLEEMEAVRSSIIVRVETRGALTRHAFDIDRGEMRYVETPSHAPFLILCHTLADFPNLRRECGDSLLGFLGGLAGLGDAMRLTSQRVRSLCALHGSLVFERIGAAGFTLSAHFGLAAPGPEPQAVIRLDEEVFARLRRGELDPQDAFLEGEVEVEGEVELAIGLALAALSPE
jgi:hypothetical protein